MTSSVLIVEVWQSGPTPGIIWNDGHYNIVGLVDLLIPRSYLHFYWNGQLVWTPALGLYLCVGDRGSGTVSSGIYRPPFCAVGTNVRRWLSYSHWQAYIHYAFIRQMASFLVSDSLTLGV